MSNNMTNITDNTTNNLWNVKVRLFLIVLFFWYLNFLSNFSVLKNIDYMILVVWGLV